MKLGKHQVKMLQFFARIGVGKYHTIARDGLTPRVAKSLEQKGLLVGVGDGVYYSITELGLEISQK